MTTSGTGGTFSPLPNTPNTPTPADASTITSEVNLFLTWQGGSSDPQDLPFVNPHF